MCKGSTQWQSICCPCQQPGWSCSVWWVSLGTQDPPICGSAILWGLNNQAEVEERARRSTLRRFFYESCMWHVVFLHTFLRHMVVRENQSWAGVVKTEFIRELLSQRRDLGMELGSTLSTAGQEGTYSQGAW